MPPISTPRRRATEGPDLSRVELLALDVAALDHVLDQRAEHRFPPKIETERLHAADEATLSMPHVGERVD